LSPVVSTLLSGIFLLAGAIAVYTLSSLQGGRKVSNPGLYRQIHRVAGWAFVGLFVVVFVFMLARVEDYWEESSARIAIHVALACSLVVMLIAKVLIPRFFSGLGKNLFALGFTAYVLSFVMVAITAGYYLLWRYEEHPRISHRSWQSHMLEERIGKELFIQKCSICHVLNEIMTPRSAESWAEVVNDMILLAEPRITPDEGEQILFYLARTHTPAPFKGPAEATLVEKHCLPCHNATEVYAESRGRVAWKEIVGQMVEYDPETVPSEKVDEIVEFLLKNQKED
jgi:nitrate/TMAO reductase-like tetraheme cytochrome c subunit